MNITHCCWQTNNQSGTWPYHFNDDGLDPTPAMIKRRLTPLGRQAIAMLYQMSHQTVENITWVVASRRTDIQRKTRLLTNLAQQALLSPTDFSMSVHNAIIGTFSIATKNTRMHTAIAGGENSFASGLLEAFALQETSQNPVGYLYYDAIVPQQLEQIEVIDYPITCIAMLLNNNQALIQPAAHVSIRYVSEPQNTAQPHELAALIDYLQHGTTPYRISLSGGSLLLAHHSPQS